MNALGHFWRSAVLALLVTLVIGTGFLTLTAVDIYAGRPVADLVAGLTLLWCGYCLGRLSK